MNSNNRYQNALEFGTPDILKQLSAKPVFNADSPWTVDWEIRCHCGCQWLRLLDFVGSVDSLDSTFWVSCKVCAKIFLIFDPTGNTERAGDPLEGYDEELVESVKCSRCDGDEWQVTMRLRYFDDLQEEAEEDDDPSYFQKIGLSNMFWWIDIEGKCKCGHAAVLMSHKCK